VIPTVAVSPSNNTHSWSLVYFRFSGKFISYVVLWGENKRKK
jgi:hypothetical protein